MRSTLERVEKSRHPVSLCEGLGKAFVDVTRESSYVSAFEIHSGLGVGFWLIHDRPWIQTLQCIPKYTSRSSNLGSYLKLEESAQGRYFELDVGSWENPNRRKLVEERFCGTVKMPALSLSRRIYPTSFPRLFFLLRSLEVSLGAMVGFDRAHLLSGFLVENMGFSLSRVPKK